MRTYLKVSAPAVGGAPSCWRSWELLLKQVHSWFVILCLWNRILRSFLPSAPAAAVLCIRPAASRATHSLRRRQYLVTSGSMRVFPWACKRKAAARCSLCYAPLARGIQPARCSTWGQSASGMERNNLRLVKLSVRSLTSLAFSNLAANVLIFWEGRLKCLLGALPNCVEWFLVLWALLSVT